MSKGIKSVGGAGSAPEGGVSKGVIASEVDVPPLLTSQAPAAAGKMAGGCAVVSAPAEPREAGPLARRTMVMSHPSAFGALPLVEADPENFPNHPSLLGAPGSASKVNVSGDGGCAG